MLHQVKAYISHWLNVVDEHSIHSPFFFDFYNQVVHRKPRAGEFREIEELRSNLLSNQTQVSVNDLGAGSAVIKESKRTLAAIARNSISQQEQAELYARIIQSTGAQRIVELGSCLGVTTLYLAQQKNTKVFTFEGSAALVNVSLTNFEYFERTNIRLIEGNIDSTLLDFLQDPAKINFVLMDANHRYAPTIKYFSWLIRRLDEKSVVVLDDIHWSAEMEKAWNELRHHPVVYGSVDLFSCGVLFFDPALNRQHFTWSLS